MSTIGLIEPIFEGFGLIEEQEKDVTVNREKFTEHFTPRTSEKM
jgi:hypothetical protein